MKRTPEPGYAEEAGERDVEAIRRALSALDSLLHETAGLSPKPHGHFDGWKALEDARAALSVSAGDAERVDERKWTRAFNRLEKAVSTHIEQKPAVGFHDEADDALHAAYRSVMKDVGPILREAGEAQVSQICDCESTVAEPGDWHRPDCPLHRPAEGPSGDDKVRKVN